jgi:hypothetical protein
MSASPKRTTASMEAGEASGGQRAPAMSAAVNDTLIALAHLLARQAARSAAGAETFIIHKDEPL